VLKSLRSALAVEKLYGKKKDFCNQRAPGIRGVVEKELLHDRKHREIALDIHRIEDVSRLLLSSRYC
jgi:hypothetical protein